MNPQLIAHLESLPEVDLQTHLAAYPWFTTARVVLAKKLKNMAQVQSASVYVRDRAWFKKYYEYESISDSFKKVENTFKQEAIIESTSPATPQAVIEAIAPEVESEESVVHTSRALVADEKTMDEMVETTLEAERDIIAMQPKSFTDWLQVFSIGKDGKVQISQQHQSLANENDELESLIQSSIPYEMLESKLEAETHYAKGLDAFIEKQKQVKKGAISIPLFDENTKLPVTETFAKLLEAQQKFRQAMAVYEKLSLKFPSKSAYFASRIQELQKKI